MRRFLVDASTLIALSSCGRLGVLQAIAPRVHTTIPVEAEVLAERPGTSSVKEAIAGGWLVVLPGGGAIDGLGRGEASLILAAKKTDIVVLDDRAARLEARSRGVAVTGLLGLVVHGAQSGKVTRVEAKATIDALARTNFRMSADLYRWAMHQIGD